jgi:GntR family transcriptional regulator
MTSNTINENGLITRDARSRYKLRAENGAHGAFEAETRRSGSTPRSEVTITRAAAPSHIAALLGSDSEVVIRSRKMFAGDRLVQLADTFIPAEIAAAAPTVEQFDTGVGGIISRMKDAGFEQAEVTEDVTLSSPSSDEASALGISADSQILTITHVAQTSAGQVVEVTVHKLSPGWTLRYGVPLD